MLKDDHGERIESTTFPKFISEFLYEGSYVYVSLNWILHDKIILFLFLHKVFLFPHLVTVFKANTSKQI